MRAWQRRAEPESAAWPVTLQHGELTLRPLAETDAAAWHEVRLRNSDWLVPWDATVPPGSNERPSSFRALSRTLSQEARSGRGLPFAIDVSGRFAGQLSVNNIVRGSALYCSIGYWIDQGVAGRGYMPLGVALAIDHCFGPVGLHRVEIAIRPENTNSLRVVEKLDIREVGYAPRYLHINGAWRDHRIFAVTAEEVTDTMVARLVH